MRTSALLLAVAYTWSATAAASAAECPNEAPARMPECRGYELVSECGTLLGSSTPERGEGSMYNAVSADGTRVFFTAVGADAQSCGGRQPSVNELLAREETAPGEARTVAISEPSLSYCSGSPSPPCADAHFEGASRDGSKVFFTSTQKLLPEAGEGTTNLYEYDFSSPVGKNLTLVSSGATAAASAHAEVQGVARISEDGSHVYFVARGVLSEAANQLGAQAEAGRDNLYVYNREGPSAGRARFVATLAPADQGDWAAADNRPVLASADGRYLVFTSLADLTGEDAPAGVAQVFRYDAHAGELVRASVGATGGAAHGSAILAQPLNRLDSPTDAASTPAPDDGAVFFESEDALVPQALSDEPHVYEYAGGLYLISEGQAEAPVDGPPSARLLGSDPSGANVFFTSVARLAAQDADSQLDIYDARVGGSSSSTSPPPVCTGSSCRGQPTPSPVLPVAGSASLVAPLFAGGLGGASDAATAGSQQSPLGIAGFEMHVLDGANAPLTQAGAHPHALTTSFHLTAAGQGGGSGEEAEAVKDVVLDLPTGLVANPTGVERCPLYALGSSGGASSCPSASRVGSLVLERAEGASPGGGGEETAAVYELAPEPGDPLELGASFNGYALVMYGSYIRGAGGEMLRLEIPGIAQVGGSVTGAALTLTGDQSLLANPETCSVPPPARLEVDTWQNPGQYTAAEATAYEAVTGCERLSFQPSLAVEPEVTEAEEPSGYTIDLDVPQSEEPLGLSTAELKRASVTLPVGVSLSPAGFNGLQSCAASGPGGFNPGSNDVSPSGQDLGDPRATQIDADGLYHTAPGSCPAESKVGTVSIATPLLPRPLEGGIFIAESGAVDGSPFGLYLEAQNSGMILKLTGTLVANQQTGQLTLKFDELPQLPIGELQLHLFGGPQALLANPQACGVDSFSGELTPWSSLTAAASSSSAFELSEGAGGEACPNATPFSPSLNAGTITPTAGSFSPFTLTISRSANQQDLARFSAQLPAGLTWLLSSVPPCSQPEAAMGTCPVGSEIGTTEVGLGPGPYEYWVNGRVYLTEGYRSGQSGLSIVLPLQLGPFAFGTLVVRAAISLAAGTEALTIATDPLPRIVDGVPLRIATVNLTIDRPEFVLNPTECASRQIAVRIEGAQGGQAEVSNPFHTPGCQAVPPTTPSTSAAPAGSGPTSISPSPTAAPPKPSISHIEERRLRGHVVVTFATSAAGSMTISGQGVRTYRKQLPAGGHRIALRLTERGVAGVRHHRRLHLELTLATGAGSVRARRVFAA